MSSQLDAMWKKQFAFSQKFLSEIKTDKDRIEFTKQMLLHIQSESPEILGALGSWKSHRLLYYPTNRSGVVEECVDMWKFLLNIFLVHNVTAEEFEEEFYRKSRVVEKRYEWESTLKNLKEGDDVIAVDLDGVMCRYPENWIEFLNAKRGSTYTLSCYSTDNVPFPDIPRKEYYELKHEFREQGFESLKVDAFSDASDFSQKLKDLGYYIIILSARPYENYKRILPDTVDWLAAKNIKYDAIVWGRDKHLKIIKELPFVKYVIEDDPNIANDLALLQYKCFLRDRAYNERFTNFAYGNRFVKRFKFLSQISNALEKM